MVSTHSSEVRSDDTLLRVEGLEKAVPKLNEKHDTINNKFDSKFDDMLLEIRASHARTQQQRNQPHTENDDASVEANASSSPTKPEHPITLLPFDGGGALW
ncbi:hypothetical protein AAHA92_06713 [Salvia divinorum]|uniref:Uncharacterized protein n=1 Tax=Salvia divinorum TaxID=28513 RepID=A0ABD1I6K6_SALDI